MLEYRTHQTTIDELNDENIMFLSNKGKFKNTGSKCKHGKILLENQIAVTLFWVEIECLLKKGLMTCI